MAHRNVGTPPPGPAAPRAERTGEAPLHRDLAAGEPEQEARAQGLAAGDVPVGAGGADEAPEREVPAQVRGGHLEGGLGPQLLSLLHPRVVEAAQEEGVPLVLAA